MWYVPSPILGKGNTALNQKHKDPSPLERVTWEVVAET